MSALDQIFIKAYTKHQPRCSARPPAPSREGQPPRQDDRGVDEAGHLPESAAEASFANGGWYRLEQPEPSVATTSRAPAPHARFPSLSELNHKKRPPIGTETGSAEPNRPLAAADAPDNGPAEQTTDAGDEGAGVIGAGAEADGEPKTTIATSATPPPIAPLQAVFQITAAGVGGAVATETICAAATPSRLSQPPIHVLAASSGADRSRVLAVEAREQAEDEIESPQATEADHAVRDEESGSGGSVKAGGSGQLPAPSWEVDCFTWPITCEQLCDCEAAFFNHAGERLQVAAERGLKVLAVASSRPGEGCSTLALCLARSAATTGVRTALMDADPESPALAVRLGVDVSCSWPDVIRRRLPLAEAAVASLADGLTLLPLTASDADASLALDAPLAAEAIRQAVEMFELVVVDLGSLTERKKARLASGAECPVDAAIVVRDLRHTTQEQTLASVVRLHELGIEAVGIAENFAEGEPAANRQPKSLSA